MSILKKGEKIQSDLVKIRREIHQNPECGFDLPNTVALVKRELEKLGLAYQDVEPSGITTKIVGGKPGKTFLLRADMDALPVEELTDLEFKSVNKNMHACGHDLHTTMLLGAIRLLVESIDELEGTVKILFQPAEELLSGAKKMVESGILENPRPDAAMMCHVMSGGDLEPGIALFADAGASYASHDMFTIDIEGVGCHGALPNTGVDPLVAMSNIHMALHELNTREIAPGEFLVATVGKMCGGTVQNVIPGTASMIGTLRTFNENIRTFAKKRIEEIAVGMGNVYRAKVKVTYTNPCPSVYANPELREDTIRYIKDAFGEESTFFLSEIGLGRVPASEDFAYIAKEIPATFMMLSAGFPGKENFPMHHPKVAFEEGVLHRGSAMLATCAMEWLKEHK